MLLSEFQSYFKDKLQGLYPDYEIQSLFRISVKRVLKINAAEIVLQKDNILKNYEIEQLQKILKRLKNSEPIQYILGETTFYGLNFKITPEVLIPRPETEELVAWIISDHKTKKTKHPTRILDIGTGSGCIVVSLAKNLPNTDIWAMDISRKALEIAQENAENNGVEIHFIHDNILSINKLPKIFDIIVSNPPYIQSREKKEMHPNVLDFEPPIALYVPDTNALIFYEKISKLAVRHLKKNGSLYFEISQYLGEEIMEVVRKNGFQNIELRQDILGNKRMIRANNI